MLQKNVQETSGQPKLGPGISVEEFDGGYFYAAELKVFAREIGISVGNFRKIELEELIREYLQTGVVPNRKPVPPRKAGAERDELRAKNAASFFAAVQIRCIDIWAKII